MVKKETEGIRRSIRQAAKSCKQEEADFVEGYLGTKRKFLCLKPQDRNRILTKATVSLKGLNPGEAMNILDDLFLTDTFEDFNFAGKLLTRLPGVRRTLRLSRVEKWVLHSNGWAECDSICQSLFQGKEIPPRWDEWQKTIRKFSKSKNIQLRRASLVLQTKPTRESSNSELRELAYETIERLKHEKETLVTKAVSWLLRSLARQDKKEVFRYLQKNKESLPKIAYRETMKKLKTRRK